MIKQYSDLDAAKQYRHKLAKKLNKQRFLTRNKVTSLFVKKSAEDILENTKKDQKYIISKDQIRANYATEKENKRVQIISQKIQLQTTEADLDAFFAELDQNDQQNKDIIYLIEQQRVTIEIQEKQKRMDMAKKIIDAKIVYYATGKKKSIDEIQQRLKLPRIASDKTYDIPTLINNDNLLKHIDNFSEEEKELLVVIAGNEGKNGLSLLVLLANEGNDKAKGHIYKFIDNLVEKRDTMMRSYNESAMEYIKNHGKLSDSISFPKTAVNDLDELVNLGCGKYFDDVIKGKHLSMPTILFFANSGLTVSEEEINKIDKSYINLGDSYIQSIMITLFSNEKIREAILLYKLLYKKMSHDNQRPFGHLNRMFKRNATNFIEKLVDSGCGDLIGDDILRWGMNPEEGKFFVEYMLKTSPEKMNGKMIQDSSLLYPGILGSSANISGENKKFFSLEDTRLSIGHTTKLGHGSDNELKMILTQEKDPNKQITYLLDNKYVSAAIGLFQELDSYSIHSLADDIIQKVLNSIVNRDANPYLVNPYHMNKYGDGDRGLRGSIVPFSPISYSLATFFKCVNKLDDTQLANIMPIIDKVIAKNSFYDKFMTSIKASMSWADYTSGLWTIYLSRLVKGQFMSKSSLEKLRREANSRKGAMTRYTCLFDERDEEGAVQNPHKDNDLRTKMRDNLGNKPGSNEAKAWIAKNMVPTTTKNYFGEDIPAVIMFGKKISLLTYHTDDKNICKKENGIYYFKKGGYAKEIAAIQNKKILDTFSYGEYKYINSLVTLLGGVRHDDTEGEEYWSALVYEDVE